MGSEQGRASGPVMSAVAGLQPDVDRSDQINRPLQPPKAKEPYHPKLELGFAIVTKPGFQRPELLRDELENPAYFSPSNRYEVLVEGRRAILRGVVADARERDLAELLVSFEPGISEVRNELKIAPRQAPAAPAPVPPEPQPIPLPGSGSNQPAR